MYPIIVFIILALIAITIIAKILCFNKHKEGETSNNPYKQNREYYIRTFSFEDGSIITIWYFTRKSVFEFYKSTICEGTYAFLLDTEEFYIKINGTLVPIVERYAYSKYLDVEDYFEHIKKDTE